MSDGTSTLYLDRPGGVLLHLTDGTVKHYQYGDVVNPDDLSDAQQSNLDRFVSDTTPKAEADVRSEIAQRAQEKAALAEAGQVGSSSSPVPGNYSELDEAGAARFIQTLSKFPAEQAAVVVYETLHANRREVVDAASSQARSIANDQIDALSSPAIETPDGAPAPGVDPSVVEQMQEQIDILTEQIQSVSTAAEGQYVPVDPENHDKDELVAMAEKAEVEIGSKDSKDVIAAKINEKAAAGVPAPSADPS